MSETKAPTATDSIIFRGNLDSRSSIGERQSIDTVVYDSLGNSYTLTFNIEKVGHDENNNLHTLEINPFKNY